MVYHKVSGSMPEAENTEEVRAFFTQWKTYQCIMEHNYLRHREAYAALHQFLLGHFQKPFSVLDFGCGDAAAMADALHGTKVHQYEGVDFSAVALRLAEKNMEKIRCRRNFLCEDFSVVARKTEARADLLWIGLSFHHLSASQKTEFVGFCRRILGTSGYFLCFEPVLAEGESRPQFLERWWSACQAQWTALTAKEREDIRRHVFSADFPETISFLEQIGHQHGFRRVESLFCDPDRLYQLVCFHA